MLNLIERIQKLKLDDDSKEGYSWLLLNWDIVKKAIKNTQTIQQRRKKIYKKIGFAPAILFSFKHLFKNPEYYVKQLESILKK